MASVADTVLNHHSLTENPARVLDNHFNQGGRSTLIVRLLYSYWSLTMMFAEFLQFIFVFISDKSFFNFSCRGPIVCDASNKWHIRIGRPRMGSLFAECRHNATNHSYDHSGGHTRDQVSNIVIPWGEALNRDICPGKISFMWCTWWKLCMVFHITFMTLNGPFIIIIDLLEEDLTYLFYYWLIGKRSYLLLIYWKEILLIIIDLLEGDSTFSGSSLFMFNVNLSLLIIGF